MKTALVAVGLATASSAFAADATLTFTGTIILPTCTVDPSSVTQTIPLGTARTTDFAGVGDVKNATPFNLKLNNCAANTAVSMTINGTADTVQSVLKNTGTATQVGVQLLKAVNVGDTSGSPITLNTSATIGTVDATNALTIPMVAQFYRLGTMTGGTVSAAATVNFAYN
ncbi:fimbrial protein [Caballeronia sp. LZ062]|nr:MULTISPECIES: fimbrial protein [unclassified Caballeronia]MDR5856696.1 fimbrial protein [Caballeronia sp. LZ050]MDR5869906.1 fimbrial protein [Caballeronia sp. LZ062]